MTLPRLYTRSLGGQCPVQGEGTIGGRPWYFRARHDAWTLRIAERTDPEPTFGDMYGWAVRVGDPQSPGWFYTEDWHCAETDCNHAHCAGYMDLKEARRLIRVGMKKYRDGMATYCPLDLQAWVDSIIYGEGE